MESIITQFQQESLVELEDDYNVNENMCTIFYLTDEVNDVKIPIEITFGLYSRSLFDINSARDHIRISTDEEMNHPDERMTPEEANNILEEYNQISSKTFTSVFHCIEGKFFLDFIKNISPLSQEQIQEVKKYNWSSPLLDSVIVIIHDKYDDDLKGNFRTFFPLKYTQKYRNISDCFVRSFYAIYVDFCSLNTGNFLREINDDIFDFNFLLSRSSGGLSIVNLPGVILM